MELVLPNSEQYCNTLNNNLQAFNDNLGILLYILIFLTALIFISYLYLIWKNNQTTKGEPQ